MSKFHWAIDSLISRGDVVFGFGWLFNEELEIKEIKLEIHFNDSTCLIPLDYGKLREDVAKEFEQNDRAKRAGFIAYGTCLKNVENSNNASLAGTMIDGSTFGFEISLPETTRTSGDLISKWTKPQSMLHYFRRSIQLIRKGNFLALFNKAVALLKAHPQKNMDSPELLYTLLSEAEQKHVVLLVDHELGGGANIYRQRIVEEMVNQGHTICILTFNLPSLTYMMNLRTQSLNKRYAIPGTEFMIGLSMLLRFQEIIFNNVVSFPNPEEIPKLLVNLKVRSKAYLRVLIHDYFVICPSYQLLDDQGVYCDIPSMLKCKECLQQNSYGKPVLHTCKDIVLWRTLWKNLLESANEIVVFSNSSCALLKKAFPGLCDSKLAVKPHKIDFLGFKPIQPRDTSPMRIGIVGQIAYHKGAKFVRDLVDEIKKYNEIIEVVVIGTLEISDGPSFVKQTGAYKLGKLPDIISSTGVNLILFSSIWPETFSYVVHEMIEFDMPIACFNLGAQAERLSCYPKGLILERMDAAYALDAMITFWKKIYS